MGIPSTGCKVCRERRVKCDETEPSCNRCLKIGRQCPGYDRGLRLVIYGTGEGGRMKPVDVKKRQLANISSSNSQGSQKDSPPSLSTEPSNEQGQRTVSGSTATKVSRDPSRAPIPSIRPSLTSDIEVRSVSLFVASFVEPSRSQNKSFGFLDFLPKLYTAASADSCLRQTVDAVAQLYFLNQYQASDILAKGAKLSYGKALRSLMVALSDQSMVATDETLTSVWLLSMYELLAPGKLAIGTTTPWIEHVSGISKLLCLRGKRQFATHTGRQLFRLVHKPIIVMTMMMGARPAKDLADLNAALLHHGPNDSKGSFLVTKFIQSVAIIRCRLREWMEAQVTGRIPPTESSNLKEIVLEGLELGEMKDFLTWTDEDDDRKPNQIPSETAALLQLPSFGTYFYRSNSMLAYWTMSRTAQMLLLQSLINGLVFAQNIVSAASATTELAAVANIGDLKERLIDAADHMLGGTAFAFGDIDLEGLTTSPLTSSGSAYNHSAIGAYHMFWPLCAVLASPYTTLDQKNLGRAGLKITAERFAIIQALNYAAF